MPLAGLGIPKTAESYKVSLGGFCRPRAFLRQPFRISSYMILHELRARPAPWSTRRDEINQLWILPLAAIEYPFEWMAYFLSRRSFLEVLEYLGSFSVLIAVIFYFSESGDRVKQKHYQAWQVINTSQGKGGSGGRIEALQELDQDGVPLVGVDVAGAFLQGVRLPKAGLNRANLNSVDARNSDFQEANFTAADLRSGNFRSSNFSNAKFQDTELVDADFCFANLSGANLSGALLDGADLGNTDLTNIDWHGIKSLKATNLQGTRNAPEGFLQWAAQNGAIVSGARSNCQ